MYKTVKIVLNFFLLGLISACSLLDEDVPQLNEEFSNIDYTFGVEQSGKLKKEFHFLSSEDVRVESDVEFVYQQDKLVSKIFTDYNFERPVVLQKDSFLYSNEKICTQLHLLRKEIPNSDLAVSKIYNYYYPDENTRIKVIRTESGQMEDSIVFSFSGKLLMAENHFSGSQNWGYNFEYNSKGKLCKSVDCQGEITIVNNFDENGLLVETVATRAETVVYTMSYSREVIGNQLMIKKYIQQGNSTTPVLNSFKKFENGKLIELGEYAVATCGSEWWCTRYEYI